MKHVFQCIKCGWGWASKPKDILGEEFWLKCERCGVVTWFCIVCRKWLKFCNNQDEILPQALLQRSNHQRQRHLISIVT
jgi:hypothetical protein